MEGVLLPAKINIEYQSRILSALSPAEKKNLIKNPTTAHYHRYSVDMKVKSSAEYKKKLNIVTFANSPHDEEDQFVNIVEGNGTKIYGTQFHPEKMLNPYYKKGPKNPKGLDDKAEGKFFDQGTAIAKALARFVVKEATPLEPVSDSEFKKLNPIPEIKAIIEEQITLIKNRPSPTPAAKSGSDHQKLTKIIKDKKLANTISDVNKGDLSKSGQMLQKNTQGVAILSCGRFSYSWYSKAQEDSTKVQFKCAKSQSTGMA